MKTRNSYVLISPCRDEAAYMRQTLDSAVAQSIRPAKWVIVDDGSTDETPQILAEYARQHDWIEIVTRTDRGRRAVGPGVMEAFYAGYETINPDDYDYLCKLGSLAMLWGWIKSALERKQRYEDEKFRKFLRRYQWRALWGGKKRAIEDISRGIGID